MSVKSIGNFTIGKTIGQGTFGKVKLGYHTLTQEPVAIKILEKAKMKEQTDLERVSREINILKKLNHPNIIQIYEVVSTENSLYLIMEYASGGELFELIIRNQRLNEKDAAEYMMQLLSGVQYMHMNNVMHRDLKPENLLLDSNKQIKIADFGLSNQFEDGKLLKTACGSPCYAAPEMIAGKEYDPKCADTWSCGVILFAMVNGYLPFEDNNTAQLYRKIMFGEYAPPKYMSPLCKDLLDKILQVDPLKRINIDQIVKHYWIQTCITNPIIIPGHGEIAINKLVLGQLTDFNFRPNDVEACLRAYKHNAQTTTYYLLLKKYYREKEEESEDSQQNYLMTQTPIPQHPQVILKETSNIQSQKLTSEIKDLKQSIKSTTNKSSKSLNNVQQRISIPKEQRISINKEQRISIPKEQRISIPKEQNNNEVNELLQTQQNEDIQLDYQEETYPTYSNPQNGSNLLKQNEICNIIPSEQVTIQNEILHSQLEQSFEIQERIIQDRSSIQTTNHTPIHQNINLYNYSEQQYTRTRQVSISVEKRPENLFPTAEQLKQKVNQNCQKCIDISERSPHQMAKKNVRQSSRMNVYKAPSFNTQKSFERPHSPIVNIKQHEGPYNMNQLIFDDHSKLTNRVASYCQQMHFEVIKRKFELIISKPKFQMVYQINLLCDRVYVVKCQLIEGDNEEFNNLYKQIINLR